MNGCGNVVLALTLGSTFTFADRAVSNNALVLRGDISRGYSVKASMEYLATVADRDCQYNDGLTGLLAPQRSSYVIDALQKDGRYTLSLPLEPPGEAGTCEWAPRGVSLCLSAVGANARHERCVTLYLFDAFNEPPPARSTLVCKSQNFDCEFTPTFTEPYRQVPAQPRNDYLDIVITH